MKKAYLLIIVGVISLLLMSFYKDAQTKIVKKPNDTALNTTAATELKTGAKVEAPLFTSGTSDENYIELEKVTEGIWVHRSYMNYNESRTESNGLIVETSEGLVLVDTPWTEKQTQELIHLTKSKLKRDIKLAIITHAHTDRIGGIDVLLENNIEVRSTKETAALSKKAGYTSPKAFDKEDPAMEIGNEKVEVYYPGEGHSPDNVVVWLPKEKCLFGGCIIKSMNTKDIGNTSDANIKQWPISVKRIMDRYKDAEIVVPGHGAWGGKELIEHTLDLLK